MKIKLTLVIGTESFMYKMIPSEIILNYIRYINKLYNSVRSGIKNTWIV